MLVVSLGLFLAGCVGAAFAWNLVVAIGFRALSGAGERSSRSRSRSSATSSRRSASQVGIGLLSSVFGVGGGFGIVLSGVIVDHLSWRSSSSSARFRSRRRSCSCTVTSRSRRSARRHGWTSRARCCSRPRSWPPGRADRGRALGLVVGAGRRARTRRGRHLRRLGVVELRTREPLVDMRMLAHRPVLLTNVTTMISGFALFSCFVLVPAFVAAPADAATASARARPGRPLPAAELGRDALLRPARRPRGRRFGPKWPLAGGMLVVGVAALPPLAGPRRAVAGGRSRARGSASASAPPSPRWWL